MLKVQIIGPKTLLDASIKALHEAAVVHIETLPEDELRKSDFLMKLPIEAEKLKEKEELERAADRLKGLSGLLAPPPSFKPVAVAAEEIPRHMGDLEPIEEMARYLRAGKDALTEEFSVVTRYARLLRGFAPVVTRLGGLKNFEIVGLTLQKTREDIAGLLGAEVSRITGGAYQIHAREIEAETIGVVLAYQKHFAPEVKSLLTGKAITEVRLPDEYEEMPLIEALKLMGKRKAEIPGRIRDIDRELSALSSQWYGIIAGALMAVEDALDEFGALSYAAATRFAYIIEGWVPAENYAGLKIRFSGLFGGRVRIRRLEVGRKDLGSVPVYIKNPSIIRPFEVFLAALSPPRYGSVDPTPYVAFFFPLFFGLIVADMGYGLLILALALYLRRLTSKPGRRILADMAYVIAISSISAILFGFLFGEFFGDLGERLGLLHPVLFNRIEALKTMIYITLGIGVGQVLLGIILSFISRLLRREFSSAGARLSYFVLVTSSLVLLGAIFGYVPREFLYYGGTMMVLSFIIFVVLEGLLAPIEFIESLGHIVSYVRIMAVGTASVVMALVANRMGSMAESLVLGVIVAGLIHSLNLLLSILSPSIQSMRLQYVEFFSKFYEGGGRRYRPFRKR